MKPVRRDLCPRFHFAVELIGRRWTGAILYVLSEAPARFCELREAIPGVTDPMLTERLRELEREGLVAREPVPGALSRARYALSPKGAALREALDAIGEWSHAWLPASKRARR